jgi:hypothetical protein
MLSVGETKTLSFDHGRVQVAKQAEGRFTAIDLATMLCGVGPTLLSAIADLNDVMAAAEPEE